MNKFYKSALLFILLYATYAMAGTSYLQTTDISKEKMKLFPRPADYRNYFFLQSVDGNTSIIIGDFTGTERMIVKIEDHNSDNTIDRVIEYYPDRKNFITKTNKSASQFFIDDIKALKQSIIDGKIFRENYSYKMRSIETIKDRIQHGAKIDRHEHGWSVKYMDPDSPSVIMSEFFFGKKGDEYDLMFQTYYYKLFNTRISPPILFSVYCKKSKDPVVKEAVEELLKIVPR